MGARSVLALLGLGLALLGSSFHTAPMFNDDVLVWVNQHPVTAKQMAFVTRRLEQGSVDALSAESRQRILELLIDEELLLQRALSLGISREDPGLQEQLVQAVIDRVVTNFLSAPVDEQALLAFYRQHRSVFESPRRVAVSALRFPTLEDAKRTRLSLLATGQPLADTALLSYLPSSPLPAHMLRRYLGITLANMAMELDAGEVTDPVPRLDGFYLVHVRHVKPAFVPEFEAVKEEVKAEYLRRGRDKALEKTLATLWISANVDINRNVIGPLELTDQAGILSRLDSR